MEHNHQVVQSSHMPRAVLTDENDVPKKATRKRAVTSVEEDGSSTPRRRAPRAKKAEVSNESLSEERVTSQTRKAPTPIASEQEQRVVGRKRLLITATVIILGFVSSAIVGFSDPGKIDINQVIQQRNKQLTSGGQTDVVTIPVQNTSQEPDGGLIGLGIEPTPPATQEATTTASTTEQTATTTEANVPLTNEEAQENAEAAEVTQ